MITDLNRLIEFRKKYVESWNCNCKKPSNYYKKLEEIDAKIREIRLIDMIRDDESAGLYDIPTP